MQNGGATAGSSCQERLDPFALPVSFATSDVSAGVRYIELHRERVVMRRSVAGVVMAVKMPVSSYDGVGLKFVPGETVAVTLEHKDPGLTVSLYESEHGDDAMAEWRSWAQVLGLPMLALDNNDEMRSVYGQLGDVRVAPPRPRRRRHSSLKRRRPVFLSRRKAGIAAAI